MTVHKTPVSVRFNDLDPYGHVNHSVYLSYFEIGRAAALADCGMNLLAVLADGFQFVVSQASVKYLAPVTASSDLQVASHIRKVRRASMVWEQSLLDVSKVVATAEILIVVTDTAGKIVRPPKEFISALLDISHETA